MKKITILGLILLGLGSYSLVSADIPRGLGWHYVEYCSKITNLNEFSDIIPIGVYRDATASGTEGFVINNNECIKEGYKFNRLSIGWIVKDKFKSIDLNKLNIDASYLPTDINILSTDFPFYIGELKNNTHIKAITTEYSINRNDDGLVSLNKSREVTEYNNGKSSKIETFDLTSQNQNVVQPTKRGFWQAILCFFRIGKNC